MTKNPFGNIFFCHKDWSDIFCLKDLVWGTWNTKERVGFYFNSTVILILSYAFLLKSRREALHPQTDALYLGLNDLSVLPQLIFTPAFTEVSLSGENQPFVILLIASAHPFSTPISLSFIIKTVLCVSPDFKYPDNCWTNTDLFFFSPLAVLRAKAEQVQETVEGVDIACSDSLRLPRVAIRLGQVAEERLVSFHRLSSAIKLNFVADSTGNEWGYTLSVPPLNWQNSI